MMIALEQWRSQNRRTLGELFFYFIDEMKDISFAESYQILMQAMFESLYAVFHVMEEQIYAFIDLFVGKLQPYIRNAIVRNNNAA